jgi:hypothetical protein
MKISVVVLYRLIGPTVKSLVRVIAYAGEPAVPVQLWQAARDDLPKLGEESRRAATGRIPSARAASVTDSPSRATSSNTARSPAAS